MTSLQIGATKRSSKPATRSQLVERPLVDAALPTAGDESNATNSRLSKSAIRKSLKGSTLDGTFSSVFENVVKGVLISNFLLGLGAGAFEVGLLTSIPMMGHLLQPLGAYFSEKTTSRHNYCLWIYGIARVLWLLPAAGIFLYSNGTITAHVLTILTMIVLTISNILESIGSASWMSWMAVLVPGKLRGRYFSLRRSLSSLTALLTIPIGGWLVSQWMGGELEGYGVVLIIAVLMGLVSLGFQFYMSDVNPQAEKAAVAQKAQTVAKATGDDERDSGLLKDKNYLTLLLFLGIWTFGVNLSAPFFNYYLLDKLHLDVQWVTIYSSLRYGAFFLAIMLWGRLADKIGNRPVLIINCVLAASVPLIWSYTDGGISWVWIGLPLLHLLQGGSFAALELCLANIQLELAPIGKQSSYFAIAAAVMGITGALGTTAGSMLAELSTVGLPALFAVTAVVRLACITPLLFVKEGRARSVRSLLEKYIKRDAKALQPVRVKA